MRWKVVLGGGVDGGYNRKRPGWMADEGSLWARRRRGTDVIPPDFLQTAARDDNGDTGSRGDVSPSWHCRRCHCALSKYRCDGCNIALPSLNRVSGIRVSCLSRPEVHYRPSSMLCLAIFFSSAHFVAICCQITGQQPPSKLP